MRTAPEPLFAPNGESSDLADRMGPEATRTFAKRERSATALRDVNRCAVRPADLIAHRGILGPGNRHARSHRQRDGRVLPPPDTVPFALWDQVDGAVPRFVSANVVDDNFITSYHLAPSPAGRADGPSPEDDSSTGGEIFQKGIEMQVNAFCGGGLRLDIIVTNHAMVETAVTLSLDLAADFADLSEAQSGERQQQALV